MTTANIDSSRTVQLLNELEVLGFNDDAFARLHHFWQRHPKSHSHETINSHRSYCSRIVHFRSEDNNARVQRRLEIVLDSYRRYHAGERSSFSRLAEASVVLVPFLPLTG